MRFNQLSYTNLAVSGQATTAQLLAPEGKGVVGSIYTHVDRANRYSTYRWTSSGPWTTYTTYNSHLDNNLIQFVNMALGDGFSNAGTSQLFTFGESERETGRIIQWSNGNRIGHSRDVYYIDNSTSNCGNTFRMLPIRNTSSAPITISLASYMSNYWSAGQEGVCLFALVPTGSTYANPGNINAVLISNNTSSSTVALERSGTITVPGNTTIIICLASSDCYVTTNRFYDTNYLYNLNTTFSNPNIICDMRMLSSLYTSRFNLPYASAANGNAVLAPLWTVTAANYGDR